MPDEVTGGETEAEYYARINSVPGIYNDRNEGAATVVAQNARNLEQARALSALTDLAPNPELQSAAEEASEPVEEPDEETPSKEEEKAAETDPKPAEETTEPVADKATDSAEKSEEPAV